MLVSVYGSLKKGYHNNRVLGSSELVGSTKTSPEYTMYSLGGFPGVVTGGDTSVYVEVYEVDNETLTRLDVLEGAPSFYKHHTIDTPFGESLMYVLADPEEYEDYVKIDNGFWENPYATS